MSPFFLSRPAIISCLGNGIEQHIEFLLANTESELRLNDSLNKRYGTKDLPRILGAINTTLRSFPESLNPSHHSRNNQLLWHIMPQLEPYLDKAIMRFGRQRIAVIIGTSTTGTDENIPLFRYAASHNQDYSGEAFNQQQQYFSAPADFLAEQYALNGLVYGISTACTSGAKALISAARLLSAGLCDAVLCGGVDNLSPLTVNGFNALSVLNNELAMPFSANRKGINIGEGAALFLLTREPLDEDSVAFLGYGASSDAYHMSSPHPEGVGAIDAFEKALANANIYAKDVDWINLHGTGTRQNDQMEALAVNHVFGEKTLCTSTKPYTGHTLGAAGAIEAAICFGMISAKCNPQGLLPAQLWDNVPDDELAPIKLTDKTSCWPKKKRIAASSSFAFGGNNTVLIFGSSDV